MAPRAENRRLQNSGWIGYPLFFYGRTLDLVHRGLSKSLAVLLHIGFGGYLAPWERSVCTYVINANSYMEV